MVINCPHCGEPTSLVPLPKRNPLALVLVIGSTLILLLVLLAVGATIYFSKSSKMGGSTEDSSSIQTNSPAPAAGEFTDLDHFKVSKVTLKKTEGSSLVYAVGTVKNDTARQRFGVKINLDLFDEQDTKIGSASDYVQILDPHKEWRFRALLTNPKAVTVKPASVEEQK